MLRTGASPDSNKLKPPKTPGPSLGSAPETPKSAFDKSPTPQPAKVPVSHESDDEEEEKDKGQSVSAASSFSNLSSSTSSFVDVSRGGEEEENTEPTAALSDGGDSEQGEQQIEEFLSDSYSEGDLDKERDEVEDEGGKREERDGDEAEEDHGGDEEQEGAENEMPQSNEADPTTVPLPASRSRSPSSTPKAERSQINVQPTDISESPSKAPPPEHLRSTTPPGSPSKEPSPPLSLQTPLQQPTPTLPSPSLSPSPAPAIGFGRPNTRPLRSSPLANAPVSGGDEEEVKGENPTSLKPHPASPKIPFGQWDGVAVSPTPAEVKLTPPQPRVEPLVDQTPSTISRPLLDTKGITPDNISSSTSVTVPVASPSPMLAVKLDTKLTTEDTTRSATMPAVGLFTGLKPIAFSPMPKPEPTAGTQPASVTKSSTEPASLFAPNHTASLGATSKLALAPPGSLIVGPLGAKAITATDGKSDMSTPARASTAPPLVTPPKDAPSGERMHPMQIEFTNLITGVGGELANVSWVSFYVLSQFVTHVASLFLLAYQ